MSFFDTTKATNYLAKNKKQAKNKSFTILVIDDEADNVTVLEGLLHRKYQVFTASSGDEGLAVMAKEPIQLVITDQRMPEMTGTQFLSRIVTSHPDTERIILTAYTDVADIISAINECQIYAFLTKPWEEANLLLTVERALEHSALASKNRMLVQDLLEKNKKLSMTNQALAKFVPNEFMKVLGQTDIVNVNQGDYIYAEMAILFSDIRAYTTLSEGMTPQEVFNFTNGYHNRMTPFIRQHNGFVQQFQGDGSVSVFPQSTTEALRAAVAIQHAVNEYNKERCKKGRKPIRIGVGLHFGPLMIGIIGDLERWESGIPSDTVNTAARMEGLTKYYGVSIVVSEPVFQAIQNKEEFSYRFLDKVLVKGKTEVIAVYEIFDSDDEKTKEKKLKTKDIFAAGQQHYYAKRFIEAVKCFADVLKEMPEDRATKHFLQRSSTCALQGVQKDWQGIMDVEQRTRLSRY